MQGERAEAERERTTPMGDLMNMLGMNSHFISHALQCIEVAVGSGAAETVIPHTLVPDYGVLETPQSRAGLCYASATGEPIPNLGEQQLPFATAEGTMRKMRFQVALVAKALGMVAKICAAGHRVVFDPSGSYIRLGR